MKNRRNWFGACLGVQVFLAGLSLRLGAEAPPDYRQVGERFARIVHAEMREWEITGIAAALVDDQQTVLVAGYGQALPDSVFRCGSISKLFTATAVMQLVEAGKLDLERPIEDYRAGLLPVNPFAAGLPPPGLRESTNPTPVTLRQLLCHRSGMIRESPAGGYFDDREPGLEKTIESLAQAVLVNPPNTQTRYSNVGPSVAGRMVELAGGEKFDSYQQRHILGPLGMTHSCWARDAVPRGKLIPAFMRVADGKGGFNRQRAPVFDLGTIPAGNLFTTAPDLARYVSMLAAEGATLSGARVLRAQTLQEMFRVQLTSEPSGFGLGFMVGKFRGYKTVSHNGAVYGHSSALVFLPEKKLGVVVLGNEDIANGRIQRLANEALSLLLEAKFGESPPPQSPVVEWTAPQLAELPGEYESRSFWASIETRDGRLEAVISGQRVKLRPVGPDRLLADSLLHDAVPVVLNRDKAGSIAGFQLGPQPFRRVTETPPAIPEPWQRYLGSYGPSFIPLIISARHGRLYAMTENMVDYRLTPINRCVFAMPPGLYTDEHLVFLLDNRGQPRGVNLANMILPRRTAAAPGTSKR